MADALLRQMWDRVTGWFDQNADHLVVEFFPADQEAIAPFGGYVRLWLAEGFLAKRRSWGNTHFPALHGGLALKFLGNDSTPFTTFAQPEASWETPGGQFDFPVTPLLPFSGGTVEAEAALYKASTAGPLATAVGLIGSLSSLMGPPLSAAATITDKISTGLDAVLSATGDQPVLAVHWAMTSPGGGPNPLRTGHLVVIASSAEELGGRPSMVQGRLHVDRGGGPTLVTGVDYLVLRVECRQERDDWRFPELDDLIRRAGTAYLEGHQDEYKARRTEAVVKAWNSTDLTPTDRKRVAKLVAEEIDSLATLGAVPRSARPLHVVAPTRLLATDSPDVSALRLQDLLA
jgi:hypothetical protein